MNGTQPPWAGRDILDRLRGCGGEPSSEDLADAIAEIERLRAREVESLPMKVRSVSVEQDLIEVVSDMFLTADEAVHLANKLTDAVDELELAEAVGGDE